MEPVVVRIICSVQRLYSDFATVVVIPQLLGKDPSSPIPPILGTLARPWTWKTNPLIFDLGEGGFVSDVGDGKPKSPQTGTAMADTRRHMDELYEKARGEKPKVSIFDDDQNSNEFVSWDYNSDQNHRGEPSTSDNRISWTAVLNNAVFLPGGAARYLNLVHIIKLKDGKTLTLPPEFELEVAGPGGITQNIRFKRTDAKDSDGFTLYAPSVDIGPITVKGRISDVSDEASDEKAFIKRTLWFDLPKDKATRFCTGRDWFSHLPIDAADAAFLPRHFAIALHKRVLLDEETSGDERVFVNSPDDNQIAATYKLFISLLQLTLSTGHGSTAATGPTIWTSASVRDRLEILLNEKRLASSAAEIWTALPTSMDEQDLVLAIMSALEEAAPTSAGTREVVERFYFGIGKSLKTLTGGQDASIQALLDNFQSGTDTSIVRHLASWRDMSENLRDVLTIIASRDGASALLLAIWMKNDAAGGNDSQRKDHERLFGLIRDVFREMPLTRRLTLDGMQDFWAGLADSNRREESETLYTTDFGKAAESYRTAFQGGRDGALPDSILAIRKFVWWFTWTRYVFAEKAVRNKLGGIIGDLPKPVESVLQAIQSGMRDELAQAASAAGFEPSQSDDREIEIGSDEPVDAPQPMTFTVGNVLRGDTRIDYSNFAGIGVLVSAHKKGDWYCLTLGAVSVNTEEVPFIWGHTPWRVITQAELDGWVVSYSGLPISARPVVSRATAGTEIEPAREPAVLNIGQSFFVVRQITNESSTPPTVPDKWKKIYALAYGRTYDFAFFAPSHAGALPQAISDPSDPTWFKIPTTGVPDTAIVSVRHLRRTGVGAPRVVGLGTPSPTKKINERYVDLPPFPRTGDWPVVPLAEDLASRSGGSKVTSERIGHLVLLVPQNESGAPQDDWNEEARTSFSCGIIPPSVSIEDYCRWRVADLDAGGDGKKVRADIANLIATTTKQIANRTAAASDGGNLATDQEDPDDPAVSDMLVEISRIDPDAPAGAKVLRLVIEVLPPSSADRLENWQAPPVRIECNSNRTPATPNLKLGLGAKGYFQKDSTLTLTDPGGTPFCSISKDGNGHVVLLIAAVAGEIYRIEVFSLVRKIHFEKPDDPGSKARFRSTKLFKPIENSAKNAELYDDWYKMASTVMTLEIAKPFDATHYAELQKTVWEQLKVTEPAPYELSISIDNSRDGKWLFPLAKRASIDRQLWAWSGRTYSKAIADINSDKILPADKHYQQEPPSGWMGFAEDDVEWFGDRSDDDAIRVGGTLQPPRDSQRAVPQTSQSTLSSGPQHRLELDRDKRASYWRYSATIENRYVGLMREDVRSSRKGRVISAWRRLLIKARPAERLPKPKLRFIIPLTQPIVAREDRAISSLLILLDEQWGEAAGIAELLQAEVVAWRDPSLSDGGADPSGKREIGIDPIVSNAEVVFSSDKTAVEIASQSPLGLTFDVRIDRPRPASSCFELRLSEAAIEAFKIEQDIMAKVRLRREVKDNLTVGSASDFASEWSAPEWVIFNADFSKWRVKHTGGRTEIVRYDLLRLSRDLSFVLETDPNPVQVMPFVETAAGSKMTRKIYVVLTDIVQDIDGREGEAFCALGECNAAGEVSNLGVIDKSTRKRARLMEVELRVGGASASSLWQMMFPGKDQDADARIRRVSPPIEMEMS